MTRSIGRWSCRIPPWSDSPKPWLTRPSRKRLRRLEAEAPLTSKPARRFKDFRYATLDSWSRRRRVVAKAKWTKGEANPRFIVTSLSKAPRRTPAFSMRRSTAPAARWRTESRNAKATCSPDRTSTATLCANQLRLWLASFGYMAARAASPCGGPNVFATEISGRQLFAKRGFRGLHRGAGISGSRLSETVARHFAMISRATEKARSCRQGPAPTLEDRNIPGRLALDRVDAPCLIDGPINGERLLAYVQQLLVPTVKPNDIVVADNLRSHKGKAVGEAVKSAGAHLLFLPNTRPTSIRSSRCSLS